MKSFKRNNVYLNKEKQLGSNPQRYSELKFYKQQAHDKYIPRVNQTSEE